MDCPRCGQTVEDGSIYCPHCCAGESTPRVIRGGIKGAWLGLLAGVVISFLAVSYIGIQRGTWGMVFGIIVTTVTTGWLWGMVNNHRNDSSR